jgi:hypothetical protein
MMEIGRTMIRESNESWWTFFFFFFFTYFAFHTNMTKFKKREVKNMTKNKCRPEFVFLSFNLRFSFKNTNRISLCGGILSLPLMLLLSLL